MKLSELKKQIKDNIYELLSEDTKPTSDVIKKTYNEMFGKNPSTTFNDVAKKLGTDEQTIAAVLFGLPVFESDDEDREPTKDELEKEKVKGAPSKFKVSNDQFEDFKDKLKTLVKKIKDMEKGEAKDKKMAALKQFIKKPELVKAFKERDVEINTGGLVG